MVGGRAEATGVPSGPFVRDAVLVLGVLVSALEEAIGVEGAGSPGGAINGELGDSATGSEVAGRVAIDSPTPVSPFACLGSEDVSLVSPPGMAGSATGLDAGPAAVLRKPGRVAG